MKRMNYGRRYTRISRLRMTFQLAWAAVTNGYLAGFLRGEIYQGALKGICVPGLNCYSCPGALGACPVGSFQAALAGFDATIPLYVIGALFVFGAFLGRVVCGWLCPFGLLQEIIWKIPFPFKRRNFVRDKVFRLVKYAILAVIVIALPLFWRNGITGEPIFCKYICPSGTIFGGWTLAAVNANLRSAVGRIFAWKSAVAISIIFASLMTFRPFCKYLCPLGAFYGFFNGVAVLRLRFDEKKCIRCTRCAHECPMGVSLPSLPNGAECIRCGRCVSVCPHDALLVEGFTKKPGKSAYKEVSDVTQEFR